MVQYNNNIDDKLKKKNNNFIFIISIEGIILYVTLLILIGTVDLYDVLKQVFVLHKLARIGIISFISLTILLAFYILRRSVSVRSYETAYKI